MARDEFTVNVVLRTYSPEYELKDTGTWDKHYHHNTGASHVLKRVMETLQSELPRHITVVDGNVSVDVVMTPEEETRYHALREEENKQYQQEANLVGHLGGNLGIRAGTWGMGNKALLANRLFAEGVCRFDYNGGWGDPVKGVEIRNPTYQDVWQAADRAVLLSGDSHHRFLEGADPVRLGGPVAVYNLSFGS